LGFVFADPEKFCEREVGERRIAGELNNARESETLFEFLRLLFGALIAPDDGWTDDVTGGVQQNCSMHLAGEANARYAIGRCVRLLQRFFYRGPAGEPPIEWVLFCPAVLRRRKWLMLVRAGRDDAAAFVNEKCACTAGSNVYA